MDDFAQSREPDDLFSDEIEPTLEKVYNSTSATLPSPQSKTSAPKTQNQQRQGSHGANQNQRGGRRGGHGAPTSNLRVDQLSRGEPAPAATEGESTAPIAPTTRPANNEEPRIISVRGDRSATGPAKPTKKTEAELSELMNSMRLKNAAKTEAHARAEKDQASFLQREQQAAAKRLEERKAIREQDMERAKNRERKIKAQGGREWDSEKQDNDVVDRSRGGSSMYTRGAHGGIAGGERGNDRGGLLSSRYGSGPADEGEEPSYGGRGRGSGRGRGRGRGDYRGRGDGQRGDRGGRGRGGHFNGVSTGRSPPVITAESEFPALPTPSGRPASDTKPKVEVNEKPMVIAGAGEGDWADEMATTIEKS